MRQQGGSIQRILQTVSGHGGWLTGLLLVAGCLALAEGCPPMTFPVPDQIPFPS